MIATRALIAIASILLPLLATANDDVSKDERNLLRFVVRLGTPRPQLSCDTCDGGYYDGCNSCTCDIDGNALACTKKRFCFWRGTPKCLPSSPAPAPPVLCPTGARKKCPDGSVVSRDPNNNCAFSPCPACCMAPKPSDDECGRSGCHCCSNGEWLTGNSGPTLSSREACARVNLAPSKSCQAVCPRDAKECPDGTMVIRSPELGCNFEACPKVLPAPSSCLDCPTGRWFDGCNTCSCSDEGEAVCTKRICNPDALLPEPSCEASAASTCCSPRIPSNVSCGTSGCHCCSDGNWLAGHTGPTVTTDMACRLVQLEPSKPCDIGCTADVQECPDGTFVHRDPADGCAFEPCPSTGCLDCPSGTWTDGCNTCSCVGGSPLCSKMFCDEEKLLPEPKCVS